MTNQVRQVIIPHLPLRADPVTGQDVPTVDLTVATKFGELKPITVAPTWSVEDMDELHNELEDMHENDLIMCLGNVVPLAAAMNIANSKFGFCTIMRFDRTIKNYRLERVEL